MTSLVSDQISKSYASGESSLQVLVDVSLSLESGDSLAIIGPSGSGKSTLLSILGTLELPSSGALRLAETDPYALSERKLAEFRSRNIGFVFQDHHLLPQCTVLENVLIPFLPDGSAGREQVQQAEELVARVGLAERAMHRPAQLSGGERQRVAIARALVRGPQLILADEPTGNLDSETANQIADLLLELQQQTDAMLVTVTHSQTLAERMQRRAKLQAGRLVEA